MSKHTPGPWAFNEAERKILATNVWIAKTPTLTAAASPSVCEEVNANNRLIAAAPELLAAAKILVEHIDSVEIDHSFAGLGTLRDVIKKAEGNSK